MLDSDNAAFIQTGVSISLASCGPDHLPSMSRGLGCKVLDAGRQVAVLVRHSQSEALLAHIRHSGRVACVFSLPSSNRTLQLKGIDAQIVPFAPADLPIVDKHLADFILEVIPLGMAEAVVRAILASQPDDLATVVYTPSAVFSQTPGPKAGERLD